MGFMEGDSRDIENKIIADRYTEHKLKREFYDMRMDRLKEATKDAKSEKEANRFKDIRKQTLSKYNKYSGTHHNF